MTCAMIAGIAVGVVATLAIVIAGSAWIVVRALHRCDELMLSEADNDG